MNVENAGPFIYDASAVLALLLGETGYDRMERMLRQAPGIISTVNYCEVLAKCQEIGIRAAECDILLAKLPFTIVDSNREMARYAAALRPSTKQVGLSLGDRFCIACAFCYRGSAVTADQCWTVIKAGVPIICIR
jgi:PIN domain nuclease of toxin-antitoxin system